MRGPDGRVLLSVAEVARMLGRSSRYVRGLVDTGDLPVALTWRGPGGGRPTAWFDPGAVFALLHAKPEVEFGWWLTRV